MEALTRGYNPVKHMPLAAGSRLDSYEIIAPLGEGGMGEVYRAHDTTLKRDVAIKVLPAYWSHDPDRLRRFEVEAQSAAALSHPNIVSIFHVGQYDGSPYIVTELLQGETLRERLRRGPMRLREVLDLGVEIARGLGAAHDARVVHRDLKPENLFLTKDGRIKILDFGLAKLEPTKAASADGSAVTFQEPTKPGHVVGTVGYMSPEQVRGQAADARSDIFAVGVILYEMLTGKRAFRRATSAETMTAILNEDPPAVSQAAASIPPGFQRIINRCLAKNPEQRFQHASDLAFALEALADSGSGGMPAVKQRVSAKKLVWIAASIAAIAIAASLFIWWKIPPAVPVVEAVTQLTDDGVPKQGPLVTDGSRIYFNEGATGSWRIAQVSVAGGETSIVPTRLADPQVAGIAPDGSSLLVWFGAIELQRESSSQLWTLPLPTGEPRRVDTIATWATDYFADGRLVFEKDGGLYVAERDGSNIRKLLGVPRTDCLTASRDRTIVFRTRGGLGSYFEVAADWNGFREIMKGTADAALSCPFWTPDGKYLIYRVFHPGRTDIWAVAGRSGLFQRYKQATQITNGPLSYDFAAPSRDGKHIFAIGTKPRGELVRYDARTRQFVPFLGGISAIDPTFSQDGQWVAYTSYSDHTLWRSRTDGTDRLQLTYPPLAVSYPFISPDGKQVSFTVFGDGVYIIGMQGGAPKKIADKNSFIGTWSPDGSSLVFFDNNHGETYQMEIFNLRTGMRSVVPSSQGVYGAQWITQDTLIAYKESLGALGVFDIKSGKWTELVSGEPINWALSADRKYLYYTTGGTEPKAMRARFADHKIEEIASLKDLRRVVDSVDQNTQISVAPDGSPIFTRDIGTQEIYALMVKWP